MLTPREHILSLRRFILAQGPRKRYICIRLRAFLGPLR